MSKERNVKLDMIKPKITQKTKLKQGRGTGHGADYIPWVFTNEFNSLGTTSNPVDYKTGRVMQLLSMGENKFYYLLRWNDNVVDIREQFPLELEDTVAIAQALHIRHPKDKSTRMTSDFLVDLIDGSQIVYSVKYSKEELNDKRTAEKLQIENQYWAKRGIPFCIVYSEDMDVDTVTNIRMVTEYFDIKDVFDADSYIKHLIATKQLLVPLDQGLLNFRKLRRSIDVKESTIWSR